MLSRSTRSWGTTSWEQARGEASDEGTTVWRGRGGASRGRDGFWADSLELQGRDTRREAGDDARHFPRPQAVARRLDGAAVVEAVVLSQAAHRIGRRSDVQAGVSHGRPQQVAAVEGGDGSEFHVDLGVWKEGELSVYRGG